MPLVDEQGAAILPHRQHLEVRSSESTDVDGTFVLRKVSGPEQGLLHMLCLSVKRAAENGQDNLHVQEETQAAQAPHKAQSGSCRAPSLPRDGCSAFETSSTLII